MHKLLKNVLAMIKKPLDDGGLRVDLVYKKNINTEKLDMYQKSHFSRYEFAKKQILKNSVCGDFACGTGYGSVMIAEKAKKVVGVDEDSRVIDEIKKRYKRVNNLEFIKSDLLKLKFKRIFDFIISFETLEHFKEEDILRLLNIYHRILKLNGKIIFSTPYMQINSKEAKTMGFHKTFFINREKIIGWLNKTRFKPSCYKYQNYQTHAISDNPKIKDFIICIAEKI